MVVGGVFLGLGIFRGGAVVAQETHPWQAMVAACQGGDHSAMMPAMRSAMSNEQLRAMMEHMAAMHPEAMSQMRQGDMSDHCPLSLGDGGMMDGGGMMGGRGGIMH